MEDERAGQQNGSLTVTGTLRLRASKLIRDDFLLRCRRLPPCAGSDDPGRNLEASDCNVCHTQTNTRSVRRIPDWARTDDCRNVELLAQKIIAVRRSMGDVPMTPHPDMPPQDARRLADTCWRSIKRIQRRRLGAATTSLQPPRNDRAVPTRRDAALLRNRRCRSRRAVTTQDNSPASQCAARLSLTMNPRPW